MDRKQRLRKRMAAEQRRRKATRTVASPDLLTCLQAILRQLDVDVIAAYMPFNGEVDIKPFLHHALAADLAVWLPRYHRRRQGYDLVPIADVVTDVVVGYFGIEEPRADLVRIRAEQQRAPNVLWLVPGVAFDRLGHRLGRGKGYYDRLLSRAQGPRAGICWEWQVVSSVPVEEHDVPMNLVVTDKRVIYCDRFEDGRNDSGEPADDES